VECRSISMVIKWKIAGSNGIFFDILEDGRGWPVSAEVQFLIFNNGH
jgi:hypothetical protein